MHSRPWGGERTWVSVQWDGRNLATHVAKHVPVHSDELGELAVRFVYLTRAAPEACRDGHRGKHPVVIEQQALEGFFDEHQILRGDREVNAQSCRAQNVATYDIGERLRLRDGLYGGGVSRSHPTYSTGV